MSRVRSWLLVAALATGTAGAADAPAVEPHLGVASCNGSNCHGAVKPIGKHPIRQDEYFIWQRKDSHAGAYNLLLEPRSNQISRRLGWGRAAEAEGCLSCHADPIPAAARGEKWVISDGVGCETCHGAAANWIEGHVEGYDSLDEAKAAGLYPTWEPTARAQLCLSCHQGSRERPMTHAIMAAGHPPLLFELDTFTSLEPYHHEIDADYRERKGAQDPARAWAVGQAVAADLLLRALAEGRHRKGLIPELAMFDCDACHHSMKAGRASEGRTGPSAPGMVPLADASVVLLGVWAQAVDAGLAERWSAGWSRLYKEGYASDEALKQEAEALRKLLRAGLLGRAESATLDAAKLRAVLGGIFSAAAGPHAGDYAFGQQAAMASLVLGSALGERAGGGITRAQRAAIDAVYETLKDRDRFNSADYRDAVAKLRSAFGV